MRNKIEASVAVARSEFDETRQVAQALAILGVNTNITAQSGMQSVFALALMRRNHQGAAPAKRCFNGTAQAERLRSNKLKLFFIYKARFLVRLRYQNA